MENLLKKIFNENQEVIHTLTSIMDDIRKDFGTLQYDKEFSSQSLYRFTKLYSKLFNNKKTRICINYNNIKFFGLYSTLANKFNTEDIFLYLLTDTQYESSDTERDHGGIFIEIDNMLLSSDIKSITIVKLMIIETFFINYKFEKENLIRYITYRIALNNGIIVDNHSNFVLTNFISLLYMSFKCSTFRALNLLTNDNSITLNSRELAITKALEDYAKESIEFMIMSKLRYNDIHYSGFNCIEILDFMANKICTDGDSYLLQRIEMVKSVSNINLVKSVCDSALNSLRDHYNSLSESVNIKDKFNNIKDNIRSKYEDAKALNKIRSFNKIHSLYSNKLYEIEVRSKNIDDEHTALIFVRDINSAISTLEEYIFENSDTLTSINKEKIKELIYQYNVLRQDLIKNRKIPKYSTLGIWIPTDYDRNPYNI